MMRFKKAIQHALMQLQINDVHEGLRLLHKMPITSGPVTDQWSYNAVDDYLDEAIWAYQFALDMDKQPRIDWLFRSPDAADIVQVALNRRVERIHRLIELDAKQTMHNIKRCDVLHQAAKDAQALLSWFVNTLPEELRVPLSEEG